MTSWLMRRATPSTLLRAHRTFLNPPSSLEAAAAVSLTKAQPSRNLAAVREIDLGTDLWFSSSFPRPSLPDASIDSGTGGGPPDERTLKLGKTIRILDERLPTLLASPLPTEILSPNISLHLFPSTHPHLPTVNGRIAYHAALWTAPVAWGRVPVVGNVKLIILSERMVRNGNGGSSSSATHRPEKLVVRWKTCGKTKGKGMGALYRGIGANEQVDKITEFLGGDVRDDEEFCGLFIFEFDEEGRVVRHTIEHAEEGGNWDKMTRVVSVTDWLLGKFNGKSKEEVPGFALGYCESGHVRKRFPHRARRDGDGY